MINIDIHSLFVQKGLNLDFEMVTRAIKTVCNGQLLGW